MVNIILASHGEFANGILQSAKMIFGEQDNLETAILTPDEGPEDLKAKLDQAVASFGENAEVLFMVDLWGGSPFNQASLIHQEMPDRTAIVAGLNLPMLLEALGSRMGMETAHEIASHIVTDEASGVRVLPKELKVEEEKGTQEEVKGDTSATLEPGTVLGDGKIEYALTRIDTRLLHGQVSTNWVPHVRPTRIIVVSDKVSQDQMRKTLIQQAAPSGMRAHTIPVSKLAEINDDPRFGATKALLLFETPQDVLKAINLGVDLGEINLGSMAHSTGKTMINRSVSVDQDDIDTLMEIQEKGHEFDVRILPGDAKEDLNKLLRKENLI